MLTNSQVLTAADLGTFEMLCHAWGAYKEADHDIHHDEETGKKRSLKAYRAARNYNRKSMSEIMEMNENRSLFCTLCNQFGMTPVARNKIDIPTPKEVDKLTQMYEETQSEVKKA